MKKQTYSPNWDLTTIPDDAFESERGRRHSLKRKTFGGGRPVQKNDKESIANREAVRRFRARQKQTEE